MEQAGTPPVGAHGLGPHVVGVRVVVRHLLPGETGPTGGPAMTDVLGVAEAWEPALVVRRDDGGVETVPHALIVSGKPVPPRASVHARLSARAAQVKALAMWTDLTVEPLGDWLLRTSPSPARRANSVLAMGPSGLPDEEAAVAAVVAHYAAHGQPAIAAVEAGSAQDELLARLGWVDESDDGVSLFQLASVATVARALRRGPGVEAGHVTTVDELEPGQARVWVRDPDGEPLATGLASCGAAEPDWVGFRSVVTEPAYRRRGLGRALMAGLVDWGAEQGATTAYLQVLAANTPAVGLYASLDFRTHHTYRYLSPAPAG